MAGGGETALDEESEEKEEEDSLVYTMAEYQTQKQKSPFLKRKQ